MQYKLLWMNTKKSTIKEMYSNVIKPKRTVLERMCGTYSKISAESLQMTRNDTPSLGLQTATRQ